MEWTSDGSEFLCQNDGKINVITTDQISIVGVIGDSSEEEDGEDFIYTFALSSDDETIITAHKSGLLKLWNEKDRLMTKQWKGIHQGPISKLLFSENTEIIASGGSDSFVRIWDYQNQICKGTLRGCQGVISVLAFHPDQAMTAILAAALDATIFCWNYESRALLKQFSGHFSTITSIVFAPDNLNNFVSSGRDKVIMLWDYNETKSIKTIPTYEGVESVIVLPQNTKLPNVEIADANAVIVASAGEEGIIKIWDITNSKLIYQQKNSLVTKAEEAGGLAVSRLLFNNAKQQIAVITADHNIIIHDIQTFVCSKQIIGFTDEILDLLLMGPSDRYLVMATNSSDIKLYDTSNMNCRLLKGHTDIVLALAAHKNLLLSSGKDNSIRLWRLDYGENDQELLENITCIGTSTKHTGAVGTLDFFNLSKSFFASASQDKCLKLWKINDEIDVTPENKLNCLYTTLAHDKDINCVCISPNDKIIATSSQDKLAKLWSATDLSLLGVLRGHKRGIWSTRFSPVDQILLTSAADCTIKLWSITDMSCIKSLEGHDSSILRAEFVTKGMQILSAGSDGLLKLWDIKTSENILTMEKHESRIWAFTLSKDESTFYSGGSDSKLIKWRDVTEERTLEIIKERQELILQEQELNNLVEQKQMLKALRLAIRLDRPLMTLKIINSIIIAQESGLADTVQQLSDANKESLLKHAINWNTNSRNCRPAQLILNILLKQIINKEFTVSTGLSKSIEEALPYTERHFKRMTEYMKDLKFLEYTYKCMQPHAPLLNQKMD